MAVGGFKIIGQDGSVSVALPFALGIAAQSALAAGAEATNNVGLDRSISLDGTQADFIILAMALVNSAEANVMYVCEVIPDAVQHINSAIAVKIKNVGSVAGVSALRIAVIAIPLGI